MELHMFSQLVILLEKLFYLERSAMLVKFFLDIFEIEKILFIQVIFSYEICLGRGHVLLLFWCGAQNPL